MVPRNLFPSLAMFDWSPQRIADRGNEFRQQRRPAESILTVQGNINANVPEPASIALFDLTIVGGAYYGWRRKRTTA
jgi:hypothetical protein